MLAAGRIVMPKGLKDILQRVLFVETGTPRTGGDPVPTRIGDLDFSFLTFDELVGQRAIDPDTTFQVLSLRSFKQAVAEEWERYARTVGLAAENTISRRLRKTDTCVQESDDTFLFLFDAPSDEAATEKLHDITEALMRRLIGDRFAGVQAQITQIDAGEIMDAVGKLDEAALDRAVEAATVVTLSSAAEGPRLVPIDPPGDRNADGPVLVTDDPRDRSGSSAEQGEGEGAGPAWTALGRHGRHDWDEIAPDRRSRLIKLGANDRPQFPKAGWETLDRLDRPAKPIGAAAADDPDGDAAATGGRKRGGDPGWDEVPPLGTMGRDADGAAAAAGAEGRAAARAADGRWEEVPPTATPRSHHISSDALAAGDGRTASDRRRDGGDPQWAPDAQKPGAPQDWHAIETAKPEYLAEAGEGAAGDDEDGTQAAGARKRGGDWREIAADRTEAPAKRWPGYDGGVVPPEAGSPTSGDRHEDETRWQFGRDRQQVTADPRWPATATKVGKAPGPAGASGTRTAPIADWQQTRERPAEQAEWSGKSGPAAAEDYQWEGISGDRPVVAHDVMTDPLVGKPDRDWGDPTRTREETAGLVESDPLPRRRDMDWPTLIEVGTVVGHDLMVDHYNPGPPKAAPWQPLVWPPPATAKRRRPTLPGSAVTSTLPPGLVAGYWPVLNATAQRVDTYMAVPMTIGEDGAAPHVIRLGPASPTEARVAIDLAMLYATLDRIERNIDARQGWFMVAPLGFDTLMPPHFETAKLILEHFPAAARGRYLLLEVGRWPQDLPRGAMTALRNVLPGLCRDVLLRIDGNGPPPQAIVDLRASGLGLDLADFGRRRCPHLPRPGRGLRTYLWGVDDPEGVAQVAKDGHWLVGGAGLGPPLSVPQPWQGPAWKPLDPVRRGGGTKAAAGR